MNCVENLNSSDAVKTSSYFGFNFEIVECIDGYVLLNNECKLIDPLYENCSMPDFEDTVNYTCKICKNGYFLNILSKCEQFLDVTQDDQCTNLSSNNSCLECNDEYKLAFLHSNQNIVCDKRRYIENCLVYDWNKEKSMKGCYICNQGYLPDVSKSSCKIISDTVTEEQIENCVTYEYGRCVKCDIGFIRDLEGIECVDKLSLDPAKTDIGIGKLL